MFFNERIIVYDAWSSTATCRSSRFAWRRASSRSFLAMCVLSVMIEVMEGVMSPGQRDAEKSPSLTTGSFFTFPAR